MAALRLSWRTRCLLLVLTMQLFVVVHSRKTSLLNIRENFEDKHAPWYSGPRRKLLQCEPCPSNAEEICSAADSAMEIRTTLISACGSSNIDERCCSLFQQSNWPVLKACAWCVDDVKPSYESYDDVFLIHIIVGVQCSMPAA